MKTEITRSTWEDVVFESRNKEYGAYLIRKSYDENVSRALLMTLLIVAFVFGVFQVASLMHIKIEIVPPTIKGHEQILPPIIIPDPPAFKQEIKSIRKSNPVFFPVATTQEPIETPPIEYPNASPIGSKTGTAEIPIGGIDQGGVGESPSVAVKPVEILNGSEVMPRYEGGMQAMVRFISRNMKYPESVRVMGQEGTVYVRFVVNDAGQVVDVDVIKGVCALLDREAMRVVGLMTKWKPGFQHDLPVNVRMVLPIKFQLEQ